MSAKRDWGPGPWHDEDDRYEGEAHGLRWLIRRVEHSGALCGYVGVLPGNKLHGKKYNAEVAIDDLPHDWRESVIGQDIGIIPALLMQGEKRGGTIRLDCALRCHGGLTFGDEGDDEYRPKGWWWFGFDCAHSGDLLPASEAYWRKHNPKLVDRHATYRDVAYVRAQCERLAEQLAHFQPVAAADEGAAQEEQQ